MNLSIYDVCRYCHSSPSAVGWEGVGLSCLRLGLLKDAREALAEANSYDNTNAKVVESKPFLRGCGSKIAAIVDNLMYFM